MEEIRVIGHDPQAPIKMSPTGIIMTENLPKKLADYTSDMHGALEGARLSDEVGAACARLGAGGAPLAPRAEMQALLKLMRAQLVAVNGASLPSEALMGACRLMAPFIRLEPAPPGAEGAVGAVFFQDQPCRERGAWGLGHVLRAAGTGFVAISQKSSALARVFLEAAADWLGDDARRKGLAEELEGFTVTLTPSELWWAVLSLLDKTLTVELQAAKTREAHAAIVEASRQVGFKMVKALPRKADGYWRAGVPCFNQLNARMALSYYQKGVEVADEKGSAFHRATLRYEVAWAILSGGEGRTWTRARVDPLIKQADALYPLLKYLPMAYRMSTEHVRKTVKAIVADYPQNMPPTTPFNCAELGGGQEAVERNRKEYARKTTCCGCGKTVLELRRCSACKAVGYCGAECQKNAWPDHKQECKRLAAEKAAAGPSSAAYAKAS